MITCFIISYLAVPLCYEREGVSTFKQYRLCCGISIKMASQPCGGTIYSKPTQCVYPQLGQNVRKPKHALPRSQNVRKLRLEVKTYPFLLVLKQ